MVNIYSQNTKKNPYEKPVKKLYSSLESRGQEQKNFSMQIVSQKRESLQAQDSKTFYTHPMRVGWLPTEIH